MYLEEAIEIVLDVLESMGHVCRDAGIENSQYHKQYWAAIEVLEAHAKINPSNYDDPDVCEDCGESEEDCSCE